jgi:hypothetical protein
MCNCRRFMNPPATGGGHYMPTRQEEMANVATHVLGIFASVFAVYHLYSMVSLAKFCNHLLVPGLVCVHTHFRSPKQLHSLSTRVCMASA